MNMETFIFSAIWQHLIISVTLFIIITGLFKFIKLNAEVRSWIWLSAIFSIIIFPIIGSIFYLNIDHVKTNDITTTHIPIHSSTQSTTQNQSNQNIIKNNTQNLSIEFEHAQSPVNYSTHSNIVFIENNKPEPTSIWLQKTLYFIFKAAPFFFLFMLTISLFKFIWLMLQCIYEYKIKQRATDHFADNIYYSDEIHVPCLVGLIHNKILLPSKVKTLSKDNRDFIIAHEHSHFQRGDQVWNFLVRLIDCVIWFNPIFKMTKNQLEHTREIACDQRAIKYIDKKKQNKKNDSTEYSYATMLIDSVNLFLINNQKSGLINLLSKKGFFRSRVNEVSHKNHDSQIKSFAMSIICCLALIASTSVFSNSALKNNSLLDDVNRMSYDKNTIEDIQTILNFMNSQVK